MFGTLNLERIWVEPYVVLPCCVKDIQYVLILLCNTIQAIEVSKHIVHFLLEHVSPAGKSERQPFPPVLAPWSTESTKCATFVIPFNLPEPASGIKDTKVRGATDLGYHIIYGSHIVRVGRMALLRSRGSRHK